MTAVLPIVTLLCTIGTFFGSVNAGTSRFDLGVCDRAWRLCCFATLFNCDFNRNLVLNCVAFALHNPHMISFFV
jgi:hypothetical protein